MRSLPAPWIDKIFAHMATMYGSKFADLWRGTDLADVKRTWAEKLGKYYDCPGAIKDALDALDDRPYPPTLPEFLFLCKTASRRFVKPIISSPAPSSDDVEKNLKRLSEIKSKLFSHLSGGSNHEGTDESSWSKPSDHKCGNCMGDNGNIGHEEIHTAYQEKQEMS